MVSPFYIVVPAAGAGTRMASSLQAANEVAPDIPKQYMDLAGQTVLERTLSSLLALKPSALCLVVSKDDQHWRELPSSSSCLVAEGGETRADSVQAGLNKLNLEEDALVLVHDAVRPLVSAREVLDLIAVAECSKSGALLVKPVEETLKYSAGGEAVTRTEDRQQFYLAQTPQAFPAGLLARALTEAKTSGAVVTDEASAVEALGLSPKLVLGRKSNIKITTIEDLKYAEYLLKQGAVGAQQSCEASCE